MHGLEKAIFRVMAHAVCSMKTTTNKRSAQAPARTHFAMPEQIAEEFMKMPTITFTQPNCLSVPGEVFDTLHGSKHSEFHSGDVLRSWHTSLDHACQFMFNISGLVARRQAEADRFEDTA